MKLSTAALAVLASAALAVAGSAGAAKKPTMPAMSMGSAKTAAGIPIVHGLKPVSQMPGMPMVMPMTPVGTASWQGMKIQARVSAPTTFILFEGGKQTFVKPTAHDDFHLMVMLTDASTGTPIPYSSVWATITRGMKGGGKPVFDERLWPMISQTMGDHYGINVRLPAGGMYHVSLLISPPAAARHMEYDNRWLTPHRVGFTFDFEPKT